MNYIQRILLFLFFSMSSFLLSADDCPEMVTLSFTSLNDPSLYLTYDIEVTGTPIFQEIYLCPGMSEGFCFSILNASNASLYNIFVTYAASNTPYTANVPYS